MLNTLLSLKFIREIMLQDITPQIIMRIYVGFSLRSSSTVFCFVVSYVYSHHSPHLGTEESFNVYLQILTNL